MALYKPQIVRTIFVAKIHRIYKEVRDMQYGSMTTVIDKKDFSQETRNISLMSSYGTSRLPPKIWASTAVSESE